MELNSNEVAQLLGMAEPQVREWAHSGKLPVVDTQRRLQFNRQAILEWALAHGHPLNLGQANEESPGLPAVAELFASERFHYDVPGRTFAEVLRSALEVFKLPIEDKELIYDLLVSREKLMTTAVGDGLAIPHLRVPIVVNVARPALSIFFAREPIDMGALDGMPVHTLFLLLSLAPKQHLELLARLTFLFKQPAFVDLLKRRADPETILRWIQGAEQKGRQSRSHK
ncbi:MAG: PTS sugar transporter subunit IIA [Verrucomicrobia bacterium]|nr:PTS sugar transporter subunit IIA [Verrucomicrobiota bacterium]